MLRLTLKSYAKLNLYLEVLNLRKDKYHNLKTIFERIDLCDKITLSLRPKDKQVRIISDSPDIPKDNSNLAFCSAKLLQQAFHINKGLDIKIIKRIPVASGLGGGSSNAACVLSGLNRLWRLNLSKDKLANFARKIGCDVPFFIYNVPFALGLGRGDRIRPLKRNMMRLWHILVVPKLKVSTPLIYKQWDKASKNEAKLRLTTYKPNVKILTSVLAKNASSLVASSLFNSLEDVTAQFYPQVRLVKDKLASLGVQSILMSGSGPAVFGIVSSRREAQGLCRQLKEANRSWQLFVAKTV